MQINSLSARVDHGAIHDRVRLYNRYLEQKTPLPLLLGYDVVGRQVDFLIAMFVALATDVGGWPWPAMLLQLGWAGHLIHEAFCRVAGTWAAFKELVARYQPVAPFLILPGEDDHTDSIPERFVCRHIRLLAGVVSVEMHPRLPGGLSTMMRADALVTAATGRAAYVELTMVPADSDADNQVYAKYRVGFVRKLKVYQALGIEPCVIWADQARSPRALAEALNALLARLDLPTRPPAPTTWYESEIAR